jgi:hypothetical protein
LQGVVKKITEQYPHYEREIERLLDASVIGDPEKTFRLYATV